MDESESPPFAAVLRRYRLAAGLSQERLAEHAGLSARGVSDLERGARRTPRLETVRRIADALELAPPDRDALLRAARRDELAPPPAIAPTPVCLPVPPTALIGRDRELADLATLFRNPATRLVTLTGPGGVGKSRLALEVAAAVAPAFPDGVHLVELAPLRDPALVLQAVAQALDVSQAGGTPVAVRLERHLRDRRILLVLDNLEHLLPAAPDIAALLGGSRALAVLATSRTPLSIRGEQQVAVEPLPFPVNGAANAAAVTATAAASLFVTRARQVRPGFTVADADAPAVAAICRRLDGLPLALELAAAHVKTLPPVALLARLERRLPLLTRGPRDLPERHQALDATIGWSYNLLPPGDRRLFGRLAVFARGWTLDAATAVIADTGVDALDGLIALVNASLIVPAESASGEPRFTMLETVREFAADRLATSGEEIRARNAHAAWVLHLVERGGPELVGPNQPHWIARFDDERDNLRAALGWALSRGESELALRLASAAWQYWLTRGQATEGRLVFDRALALVDGAEPSPILTEAWFAAGTLAAAQEDFDTAEPLLRAALAGSSASTPREPRARATQTLGIIALNRDDPARAAPLLEEAIAMYGQPVHPAFAPWHALAHSQLAGALSALGEHDRAATLGGRGLTLQQEIGSELGEALARFYLGDLARRRNETVAARRQYGASIATLARLGDRWYIVSALACWLAVAASDLSPRQAARLMGAHAAIRSRVETPVWPPYAGPLAAAEARVREKLSEAAFTSALQHGAALDLDATIAEILAIEDEASQRPGASRLPTLD